MNRSVAFSLLLVAAFVLPAVDAGTADAPELTDPAGDAPGPVDVVAAWFGRPGGPLVTTGTEADCQVGTPVITVIMSYCDPRVFTITVKVSDLLLAAPIADEDPLSTRYYYVLTFTPSSWGEPVQVTCLLNYLDIARNSPFYWGAPELSQVGRACRLPDDGTPGDAVRVLSTGLNRSEGTLTVILGPDLAEIGPGTTFSGLRVKTTIGGIQTSTPPLAGSRAADTTGAGADWTM